MRKPIDPDSASPFYERGFSADETAEFLSHYARVFGDVLNPWMERFWNGESDPPGKWPTDRLRSRKAIQKALDRLVAVADSHRFDLEPLLWMRRYVDGAVARDARKVTEIRYLYQRICVRELGSPGDGWREYDEAIAEAIQHTYVADPQLGQAVPDTVVWSRPMSKTEGAKLLGYNRAKKAEWINRCVEDGTHRIRQCTRQSVQFDMAKIPANLRDRFEAKTIKSR